MQLKDVFPKDLISEKLSRKDITFQHFTIESIDEIVARKSNCMFELGAVIWDKYMQTSPSTDPMQLASHFQISDPYLYKEVSRILGTEIISDIVYSTAEITDGSVDYTVFSELLIAVIYPDILHISDVEFSNPYKPIPEDKRKYTFQYFEGLGLLGELIDNCIEYCKLNDLSRICLTAAHIDLVPLFEKYGFKVDDTPSGRRGMTYGLSIPMTKPL